MELVVKHHLPIEVGDIETVEGDKIGEFPILKGPWPANPARAVIGSGKVFPICWVTKVNGRNVVKSGNIQIKQAKPHNT